MRVSMLTGLWKIAVAIALAATLSACAALGPSLPSPDLVGSRDSLADTKPTNAAVAASTDVASLPTDSSDAYDPYEKMNRSMFEQNEKFNRSVIYPLAGFYRNNVPQPVRNSVENFASNLAEPMVFANDVLQLRLDAAATTVGRFAINSTVGLGGLSDVASRNDMPQQSGDFGQTLYVWGMRKSPYLIVPIIGPTNVRDLFGTGVEVVASIPAGNLLPTQIASAANNITVAGTIASPFTKLDDVDDMRQLEDSSLDFYTMLRSVVDQKRQAELQEALAQSAWTSAGRANLSAAAPTQPAVLSPFQHAPAPKTPTEEFMANTLQGTNGVN
jgi:phospholipid-binding lipoprotein MlaA